MATQYTSLLGLALPVTGELSGSWGDTVNDAITSLLDTAVAGTTSITTDADITLTTTTGVANQARQAIILWNPASGTTTRNITAPAQSKIYTVINASGGTQSIVFRGAGPTTGVTIVKGESAVVAWNGSDFIKVSNTGGSASFTNVTVSGTTTLSGLTASTALALDASKNVVSVTNTGTGNNVLSASPTLTGTVAGASLSLSSLTATRVPFAGLAGLLSDSANMTFNGTRLTVADLADSGLTSGRVTYASTGGALVDSANLTFDGTTLTANALTVTNAVTLSAATANGVVYANGSKVLTTGSALTFDGTNFGTTGNANLGSASKSTDTQLNFASDLGTQRIYLDRGTRSLVFYDATTAIENYRIAGITGIQTWGVGGSEQMRLTSTGLGIGTSSPAAKLNVQQTGTGNFTSLLLSRTTGNTLEEQSIVWQQNDLSNLQYASIAGAVETGTTGSLRFKTNGGSGLAERMRLNSSGNLGIGTTSPAARLDVRPSATNFAQISSASHSTLTGLSAALTFSRGSDGIADLAAVFGWNNGGLAVAGREGVVFATGGGGLYSATVERMRLDSSGNLGLGVTPSAWGSSFKAFQLPSVGVMSGLNANSAANYFNNSFFNGTNFIYSGNGQAARYEQGAGVHAWYNAPSGTSGNAISFTQAMTLDASGNLGIGTSSPSARLHSFIGSATQINNLIQNSVSYLNYGVFADGNNYVYSGTATNLLLGTNNTERMRITATGDVGIGTSSPATKLNVIGDIQLSRSATASDAAINFGSNGNNYIFGGNSNNIMAFATNGSERMRIDSSGNLLVGATSTTNAGRINAIGSSSNGNIISNNTAGSGTRYHCVFYENGTERGSITSNGSATSYNTSSDYRLKNTIAPMTGALAKVALLKPCTYKWNADGSDGQGFIAHELQAVVPQCVTGEKDAVDAEGKPVYQGIDTSFLVATLTAAIQELKAEFDAYKASHP